ncbi:hypothetical protein [Stieleria varia]|uniref:Uncharacterized protein n=1 Tax=Stieleria varia TaxID=2528005 RepID=A0A5C6B6I1_9BACT|nr:hypothetical protein [Stieleria varia]TWU06124.1 hypothetical protein Pla52n_18440 [Stieleria varia]
MSKFVILEHRIGPGFARNPDRITPDRITQNAVHWDWMFQTGDVLRTWATDPIAGLADAVECCDEAGAERPALSGVNVAQRLADHRIAYLTLEGDIGRQRGTVRRILSGVFGLLSDEPDRFSAECSLDRRVGRLAIEFHRSVPERSDEVRDADRTASDAESLCELLWELDSESSPD